MVLVNSKDTLAGFTGHYSHVLVRFGFDKTKPDLPETGSFGGYNRSASWEQSPVIVLCVVSGEVYLPWDLVTLWVTLGWNGMED